MTSNPIREMQEIRRAIASTADVLPGANDLTFDSAEGVYAAALNAMGVDTRGIHPSAWRDVFLAHRQRTDRGGIAMDAAADEDYARRFPHAAKIGINTFGSARR